MHKLKLITFSLNFVALFTCYASQDELCPSVRAMLFTVILHMWDYLKIRGKNAKLKNICLRSCKLNCLIRYLLSKLNESQ